MYLSDRTFENIIDNTPLISIDLLVQNSTGQYLLGKRNNAPAKGFWFVPGGRILKNESMDTAFTRLCKAELGLDLQRKHAEFLGPYEHFYADSVFSPQISTHYVVLGYKVVKNLDVLLLPKEQHNQYAWFSNEEIRSRADIHQHSKWYI